MKKGFYSFFKLNKSHKTITNITVMFTIGNEFV